MTKDMLLGVVRHVLSGIGATLVTKGVLDSSSAEAIVGGAIAVIGVFWSMWDKKGR